MALECSNIVSELAKQPDYQFVPVVVMSGVEMMAMLQLEENRFDVVKDHISRLNKMSTIYPSVRLVAQKLGEALQEKLSKMYERPDRAIEHEGILPKQQYVTFITCRLIHECHHDKWFNFTFINFFIKITEFLWLVV